MKCLCGYYLVPILLLVCSGKESQLCLTSSSLDVEEGGNITFSCTSTSSNDLMVVIWIGGNVQRCKSEWNGNITITSTEQNPCEIASTSSQQHNVTVIMSSADDGTAWSCNTVESGSNFLNVNVTRQTTVSSSPQTTTQQGQESTYAEYSQTPATDEQTEKTSSATMYVSRTFNYIMIGSVGGSVTMSLAIVVIVCGTSKKRRRQSSTQSSSATGQTSDHEPEDRNDSSVMTRNPLCDTYLDPRYSTVEYMRTMTESKDEMPQKPRVTVMTGNRLNDTYHDPHYSTVEYMRNMTESKDEMPQKTRVTAMTRNPLYDTCHDPRYSTVEDMRNMTESKDKMPQKPRIPAMTRNPLYDTYPDPRNSTVEDMRNMTESKDEMPQKPIVTDIYAQVQKKKRKTDTHVNVDDFKTDQTEI